MDTIGGRIEAIIKSLNKNTNSFGKSIDKPNTTIANIIANKSKPGAEILESILEKYPMINAEWLMTGNGEMFRTEKPKNVESEYLMDFLKKLEEEFKHQLAIKDQQLAMKDQQINKFLDLLGKLDGVIGETPIVEFYPSYAGMLA